MRRHETRSRSARGFSLVEIMVAAGIIIILVAVFVPVASSVRNSAKAQLARSTLTKIESVIEDHAQDWRRMNRADGWNTTLDINDGGGNPVQLQVPGFPEMSLDDSGGTPRMPVWDAYGPGMRKAGGGRLFVDPGEAVPAEARPQPRFEANQCLAWALTAEEGEGPYLTNLDGATVQLGLYKHPVTGQDLTLAQAGAPLYPLADGSTPAADDPKRQPKVHLVDPWGEPYLYAWEIQVDTSDPNNPVAAFVQAWVGSSGPDRLVNFDLWVRDTKNARAPKAGQPGPEQANADNIEP